MTAHDRRSPFEALFSLTQDEVDALSVVYDAVVSWAEFVEQFGFPAKFSTLPERKLLAAYHDWLAVSA